MTGVGNWCDNERTAAELQFEGGGIYVVRPREGLQ